jgi:hypothetical protein
MARDEGAKAGMADDRLSGAIDRAPRIF